MATSKVTDSRSVKFIDTVESCTNKGILLKAKDLVWKLGHLRIPQEKMDSLISGQFSVASSSHDLQWIRAIRKEATLISLFTVITGLMNIFHLRTGIRNLLPNLKDLPLRLHPYPWILRKEVECARTFICPWARNFRSCRK